MVRQSLDRIGVIGAGTMGSGIAQVAATNGYAVVLRDVDPGLVESGVGAVEDSLGRLENRDALPEEPSTILDRIEGTTEAEPLRDCDAVVEAVVEELTVKRDVFAGLEETVETDVMLATNTSTLSITSIASELEAPERVVGLHFMNPVPIMEGVEVVVAEHSSDDVVSLAHALAEDLGKTTWEADDKPGFVTNRILMPWINEGIRAYDEGVATRDDVDRGMRLGTNVPMGPLELADHIGLDVCLYATQTLHDELGDRYAPAYLLKRKVEAGDLGKKTGAGFYEYDG